MEAKTDLQIKLIEAMKAAGLVVPETEDIEKIQQEIQKEFDVTKYSAKEMGDILSANRLGLSGLITTEELDKVRNFLNYVYERYQVPNSFKGGGMADYMVKHKINMDYRSLMTKNKMLTVEGDKLRRTYKYIKDRPSRKDAYDLVLELNAENAPSKKRTAKRFTIEQIEFIKKKINEGLNNTEIANLDHPLLKGRTEGSIAFKASAIRKEMDFPKPGTVKVVSMSQGKMPSLDSELNRSLLPVKPAGTWSMYEELALRFYKYYGLSASKISERINRSPAAIYSKFNIMKENGEYKPSRIQRFLIENLDKLNKLFVAKEEKKEEPKIEETQQEQKVEKEEVVEKIKEEKINETPTLFEQNLGYEEVIQRLDKTEKKYKTLNKKFKELEVMVLKMRVASLEKELGNK